MKTLELSVADNKISYIQTVYMLSRGYNVQLCWKFLASILYHGGSPTSKIWRHGIGAFSQIGVENFPMLYLSVEDCLGYCTALKQVRWVNVSTFELLEVILLRRQELTNPRAQLPMGELEKQTNTATSFCEQCNWLLARSGPDLYIAYFPSIANIHQ